MDILEKLQWLAQFTLQQKIEMARKIMDSLPDVDPKTGKYVVSPVGGEQQNSAERK